MSFARRGPGGGDWGVGAKMTSAQINGIDTDHANAVDKTGDTVTSVINFNAAGAITVGAAGGITIGSSGSIALTSRTLTRFTPYPPVVDAAANWTLEPSAGEGGGGRLKTAVTTQSYCYFPVRLPHGCLWTTTTIYVAGGAYPGLPGTMPNLEAFYSQPSGYSATRTTINNTTDTSGSTGAFNAGHTIQVTGLAHTVANDTNVYGVRLRSSSGANSTAGFQIYGLSVTYQITAMDFD